LRTVARGGKDVAMDTLFDLRPTHNSHRWYLPVTPEVSVGPIETRFLFGGVGLASAITAMERTSGRPVIWATAQYLSFARPPSTLDLDVWILAGGARTSQARVVGHVEDKEIFTVNAALGRQPGDDSRQWLQAPSAPPPEDCEVSFRWNPDRNGLQTRIEVRVAPHDGVPGRRLLWARPRERFAVDSGMLAVFADLVPSGVGAIFDEKVYATSLDNTLRVNRIVPTEWVLCEITTQSVHAGFAHAAMSLFAQDGQLMAIASQSMVIRERKKGPAPGGL